MQRLVLFFFLFLSLNPFADGQEFPRVLPRMADTAANYGFVHTVSLNVHRGANATSSGNDWVKDIFQASGYSGLDLRLGWTTTGNRVWHQMLHYPQYGLGFSSFTFDDEEASNLIGDPAGVYAWVGIPLFWNRRRTFHVDIDGAAGLTYDLNPYDPITNPYNDAVGSRILFYFDFTAAAVWRISRRLDMNAGLNLIHFSNGRTRTPNLGVNLLGLNAGLSYFFNPMGTYTREIDRDYQAPVRPSYIHQPLSKLRGYNIWTVFAAAGWNTTNIPVPDDIGEQDTFDVRGPAYFANTVAVEYARRHGRVGAFSLGLNYHFDGSLGPAYPPGENVSVWDRSTIGAAAGYELFINQFSIICQLGLYAFQNDVKLDKRGTFYIRAGIRGRLTPHLFLYGALKTMNGGIADYVEWGIGYSIFDDEKAKWVDRR